MSNGDTYVDVRSEKDYHLGLALDLCLNYHSGPGISTISHALEHNNAIYFGWHANSGGESLTGVDEKGLSKEAIIKIIKEWLLTAEYGDHDDIDGSVYGGWRIMSHYRLMPDVRGKFYLTFGVEPCWMYYHK